MCIEDIWIGRHTKTIDKGNVLGSYTLPANPNRIGIRISGSYFLQVARMNGERIVDYVPIQWSTQTTGTITTVARPGVDTTSVTQSSVGFASFPFSMDIREYGEVVCEELIVTVPGITYRLWELVADPELQEAIRLKEKAWK